MSAPLLNIKYKILYVVPPHPVSYEWVLWSVAWLCTDCLSGAPNPLSSSLQHFLSRLYTWPQHSWGSCHHQWCALAQARFPCPKVEKFLKCSLKKNVKRILGRSSMYSRGGSGTNCRTQGVLTVIFGFFRRDTTNPTLSTGD